jgi:hypothetical protein
LLVSTVSVCRTSEVTAQQEWQFLQHVMLEIGEKFTGVEKVISADFLTALFDDMIQECDKRCTLAGLPVKHAGLALPNPTTSADCNHEASTLVCLHMLAAFQGIEEFQKEEHASVHCTVLAELLKQMMVQLNETLASILTRFPCDTSRMIR